MLLSAIWLPFVSDIYMYDAKTLKKIAKELEIAAARNFSYERLNA